MQETHILQPNVRSLADFAMQVNAAGMTRLAARLAVESGIKLLATVHDSWSRSTSEPASESA